MNDADGGQARTWHWPTLDGDKRGSAGFRPMTPGQAPRSEDESDPEAGRRAEELLRSSRKRAQELLEQAEHEAERLRCEARDRALREVRERLDEALRETVAEEVAAFEAARDALLEQLRAAWEARVEELERELVALVTTMAERVINRTLEDDPAIVVDVVRAAIAEAQGAKSLTVRVAAADEELVRAAEAELLAATEGAEELRFVADGSVGAGGCIVETERGRFDARIETQLELLGAEIDRALGDEAGHE